MSELPRCDGISNGHILNTSQPLQTAQVNESGKKTNKRQKKQQPIESEEGATPARFQPLDLKSLTFKPIGSEQEVNIWYAEPHVFHVYISQFIGGFRKVNIDVWPLAERLALVNHMWAYADAHGIPFPFQIRQQVVPDVNAGNIPDVNRNSDNHASEAV